jgi:hypothetical protein
MGVLVAANGTARKAAGVILALLCVTAFSAGPASAARKPLPRPTPVAGDALARALARGDLTPAAYALERARSLFRLQAVRREFGDVARPDPHAATLILRDLALRAHQLSPTKRQEARAILARPDDGEVPSWTHAWPDGAPVAAACDANVCFHWITDDAYADAPPLNDGPPTDGIPDWVDTTADVLANVWTVEVSTMGYRAPKSDATSPNNGGNNRLDVYLSDLGGDGVFGYCATDDPDAFDPTPSHFHFSAYCVLDNDFTDYGSEFTPLEFLQVTTAHEFHHASQFAYDAGEDIWLMEGEAMWMEGQVYPAITDRFDYLGRSPLGRPSRSLDHGKGFHEYGAWVFFQYLSERFGAALVREIWEFADAPNLVQDQYSMQAVASALAPGSLPAEFTKFAEWNRTPAEFYAEGADYPAAPTSALHKLGPGASTGWQAPRLRHLASAYYSFAPRSTLGSGAKLRVSVDLPSLNTKPSATVLIFYKNGDKVVRPLALDSAGNAGRTVTFGRGVVSRVDLVLTNASPRYKLNTCWTGTTSYSCGGAVALDELRTYRFKASVK